MDWQTHTYYPEGHKEKRKMEMDFQQGFLQIPPTFAEDTGMMMMMINVQKLFFCFSVPVDQIICLKYM